MIEQVFLSVHDAPLNIRISFQCHSKIFISNKQLLGVFSSTCSENEFSKIFFRMNPPKWRQSQVFDATWSK